MGDNGAQVVVTSTHQHFRWLLAGAAAGLAVDLSLYPLDTIKTRMQSKGGFRTAGGFAQIYRGIPAVVLGSAPGSAIFFLTYSSSRELFQRKFDIDSNSGYAPLTDALSATLGEICACVARVPTEIVKQRAQTTPNHRLVHIMRELYAGGEGEGKAGVRGFYKGYASTVCREIPFSFIEFPLWEWLKRRLKASTGRQECTPLESAACGSLAGLTAAAITTPLDVLKTRIMLDRSRHTVYLLPLAISIFRHEGMRRLYAGMLPRALWMGLGGFVFFFSYEFSLRATEYLF